MRDRLADSAGSGMQGRQPDAVGHAAGRGVGLGPAVELGHRRLPDGLCDSLLPRWLSGPVGPDDRDRVVELRQLAQQRRGGLGIGLDEQRLRMARHQLAHLTAVRGLVEGHIRHIRERAADLLVAADHGRCCALGADVGAEGRRRARVTLLMSVQGHGQADGVVRGSDPPEVLVAALVEELLPGVSEHGDLGPVEQRHGRRRLVRARSEQTA